MLELACCISFAVDVGDLLHLEASFHRYRIVDAAADEEDILLSCELCCEPLETFLVLQDLVDLAGDRHDFACELCSRFRCDRALCERELDSKDIAYCELG